MNFGRDLDPRMPVSACHDRRMPRHVVTTPKIQHLVRPLWGVRKSEVEGVSTSQGAEGTSGTSAGSCCQRTGAIFVRGDCAQTPYA